MGSDRLNIRNQYKFSRNEARFNCNSVVAKSKSNKIHHRFGWKATRAVLESKYAEVAEALEMTNVRDTEKVFTATFK